MTYPPITAAVHITEDTELTRLPQCPNGIWFGEHPGMITFASPAAADRFAATCLAVASAMTIADDAKRWVL